MEILKLEQDSDLVAQIARVLGIVFLSSSFLVLVVLLNAFVQFMSEPNSVFAINAFFEYLQANAASATVIIDGREAIVDIDPALRLVLVIFVGAITILALGSILHAFIGGGLALLKFAKGRSDENDA